MFDKMKGQPLCQVIASLPSDCTYLSDMQEEAFVSIGAVNKLTPSGREQYKNIWNATIHEIRQDDDDTYTVRLENIAVADLEQFGQDYDNYVEAEQQMGAGMY